MNHFPCSRRLALGSLTALLVARPGLAATAYDPISTGAAAPPQVLELSLTDAARQRLLPLRVYLPTSTAAAPVVLFSHGLGGSREGSAFLGQHWAARGCVAVFLQHPGSDTSVWQNVPLAARMQAMRAAANASQLIERVHDVSAVLDQLERWQGSTGHPLQQRLDLARIGMSGHSFGALTTQAVSGQGFRGGRIRPTEARIQAALVLSPSGARGLDAAGSFSKVNIPWMLMTGTRDTSPIGDADVASRLSVFPALPAGGKYELVLDGAEHSVFTERPLPGESAQRNPNHQRAIKAISSAFWDAWLGQNQAARAWLDGPGPRSVLQTADRWQLK